MSIESELTNLTFADVLNTCGLASPCEIREEEFPFLMVLCGAAREAGRCGRSETEIRWLRAAAVALRAIILTARRKSLPETERFLRETAGGEFFNAMDGMRPMGAAAEFSPSIIQEARACRDGNLAGFLASGIEIVYPLLMWVAVVRGGDNLEDLQGLDDARP